MNDLKKFLQENKNQKLALFNKKIISTDFQIYGVALPNLRKEVKVLAGNGVTFAEVKPSSLEEVLAKGLLLSYEKDVKIVLQGLKSMLSYFDNWCAVDVIVGSLKKLNGKDEAFSFFKKCLTDGDEFVVRTGIVGLMKFFAGEKYIKESAKLISEIKSQLYYIKMAQAWAFCEFFIKNFDIAKDYFLQIQDKDVKKKTAQKCRDSFRLSKEQKQFITSLT